MLSQICDGFVCDHPVGRLFDRYFQCQVAPQAVRSRTEQIASTLVAHALASQAEPYRVVSVGAGPARDIEQAVRLLPPDRRSALRVRLLDLDDEALSFARGRLDGLLRTDQHVGLRENLFRLHQRSRGKVLEGPADFLICSGLFDYLDDENANALLRWFCDQLAPGGMLVVGNFAPHCATRAYMEWIGNWYLHYRTPREFARFAERARIAASTWGVGVERFGVDLFLHVTKVGGNR
jgi:extracellular factor (EF) 3-hydroxypalmitic acid methyl ester biosynthesis protein